MKDTAGEERFRSLSTGIFKGADACFLFYDTACVQTFKNLPKWKNQLEKMNPNLVLVLIGTKADLKENRDVTKEDATVCTT